MNKTRITRHEEFEVAHILPDHKGACKNLHGHTYKIEVTVEGPQRSQEFDMVMDFTLLKEAIKEVVPDHKFICSDYVEQERDTVELDIVAVLRKYNLEYEIYPFMTTAENLSKHYANEIEKYIQRISGYEMVEVVEVKLWETTNSYAHYIKGNQ